MNLLFVLRRILLLLCLLGAQHAALAHAYEHDATFDAQPVPGSEHRPGLHVASCAECMAGQALNAALPATPAELCHGCLDRVCSTVVSVQSAACRLPDLRAHGPPSSPLI